MADYIITTDSSVDLSKELMEELGVPFVSLAYVKDGIEYLDDMTEQSAMYVYSCMRNGEILTTSQAISANYVDLWTPYLEAGKDIVHLGFSSGLSGSVNSAMIAARELEEKYPRRKIYVTDSLCASSGQGLLLLHLVERKKRGFNAAECNVFLENNKLRVHHWFTVDDLVYLKRGGRVSAATALVANLLNIKPVLNVNKTGHLIPQEKAKGRRAAIKHLFSHMCESIVLAENPFVIINHADCLADAEYLKGLIAEKYPSLKVRIFMVGAVIGSHSGPGTLSLFFMGTPRTE